MRVDLKIIEELSEKKLVSTQSHPKWPLLIHNYTQVAQYERAWDDMTRMCRGLITDLEGNVIARPFPKFFNIEEHEGEDSKLPKLNWNQPFTSTRKEDGSLGILYWTPDGWQIATRGSFTSDQAIKATEMFYAKGYDKHNYGKGLTHLFEIVYPSNRIVLDYKGLEDLILLEILDTETGGATSWERMAETAKDIGCPVVPYMALSSENIQRLDEYYGADLGSNEEGLVVRFNDDTRVKIKYAEYKRLHRLVTMCSARSIWENLKDGKDLGELLERVPDEFMSWVKRIVEEITRDFSIIESDAKIAFNKIRHLTDRKQFALIAREYVYPSILFAMLDGKDYSHIIWKLVKPESTKPFQQDIDA